MNTLNVLTFYSFFRIKIFVLICCIFLNTTHLHVNLVEQAFDWLVQTLIIVVIVNDQQEVGNYEECHNALLCTARWA